MADYKFTLSDQDEKDFSLLNIDFSIRVSELVKDVRLSAVRQRAFSFIESLPYMVDDDDRAAKIALISATLDANIAKKPAPPPDVIPPIDEIPPPEPPIEVLP